jgi:large subunit ribosomal protein L3
VLVSDAVKRKAPKDLPFPAALRSAAAAEAPAAEAPAETPAGEQPAGEQKE